jgi:hypothetical protein
VRPINLSGVVSSADGVVASSLSRDDFWASEVAAHNPSRRRPWQHFRLLDDRTGSVKKLFSFSESEDTLSQQRAVYLYWRLNIVSQCPTIPFSHERSHEGPVSFARRRVCPRLFKGSNGNRLKTSTGC